MRTILHKANFLLALKDGAANGIYENDKLLADTHIIYFAFCFKYKHSLAH